MYYYIINDDNGRHSYVGRLRNVNIHSVYFLSRYVARLCVCVSTSRFYLRVQYYNFTFRHNNYERGVGIPDTAMIGVSVCILYEQYNIIYTQSVCSDDNII